MEKPNISDSTSHPLTDAFKQAAYRRKTPNVRTGGKPADHTEIGKLRLQFNPRPSLRSGASKTLKKQE